MEDSSVHWHKTETAGTPLSTVDIISSVLRDAHSPRNQWITGWSFTTSNLGFWPFVPLCKYIQWWKETSLLTFCDLYPWSSTKILLSVLGRVRSFHTNYSKLPRMGPPWERAGPVEQVCLPPGGQWPGLPALSQGSGRATIGWNRSWITTAW